MPLAPYVGRGIKIIQIYAVKLQVSLISWFCQAWKLEKTKEESFIEDINQDLQLCSIYGAEKDD